MPLGLGPVAPQALNPLSAGGPDTFVSSSLTVQRGTTCSIPYSIIVKRGIGFMCLDAVPLSHQYRHRTLPANAVNLAGNIDDPDLSLCDWLRDEVLPLMRLEVKAAPRA